MGYYLWNKNQTLTIQHSQFCIGRSLQPAKMGGGLWIQHKMGGGLRIQLKDYIVDSLFTYNEF